MSILGESFGAKKTEKGLVFTSLVKIFPYVVMVRDLYDDRFWDVNCCRNKDLAKDCGRHTYSTYKQYSEHYCAVEIWKKYKRVWRKYPKRW